MRLQSIKLSNYRNYESLELETPHMVNVFLGANAQGKTNLLESILVLALTKSHRTAKDKELIGWQGDHAYIGGVVDKKYGRLSLELTYGQKGKKAKLNGLEQRKLSNYVGGLNVVMFAPEDLEIVKGTPGVRRRFLDMEIGQVQPGYLHWLQQYHKVLQQRNNVLKNGIHASDAAMLEVWNMQLAQFGVKIMMKRQHFIDKLQTYAQRIHAGITNDAEQLRLAYKPSLDSEHLQDEAMLFEQFMVKLSQVKDQEFRRGISLVGPHRDDIAFFINEKEAQVFGSQGQQRTTALSIKLAELELIHEEIGEYPILLLDDVLSELDRNRQTQLIETFQSKVQTFITTTGLESVDMDRLHHAGIYYVKDGKVSMSPD
ncbi:DNA replication/repair protein RecF [Paenibacillus camelliae]|uniref:DNA replication/repair protein RecF n=1 Tax=Paenibacillus camelliae TaxID=512410 RepID=UPI00204213EB|nr:DNA replication/repair protein RecF [Paenibacillus camelliae]